MAAVVNAPLPMRRQPDIEFARVLAITTIFFAHFVVAGETTISSAVLGDMAPWLDFGEVGVAMFIAISGATVALAVARCSEGTRRCVVSRLRRIFAEYWFIAIPLLAIGVATGRVLISELWKIPLWLLGLGFATPASYVPPVSAWWYMAIAWQVVVTVPFVWSAVHRFGPRGAVLLAAAIMVPSVLAIPMGVAGYPGRTLVVCRLLEVLAGCLVAIVLWGPVGDGRAGGSRRDVIPVLVSVILLQGTLAALTHEPAYFARACGLAAVAVLSVWTPITRFGSDVLARALVHLGRLTYPFFLVHILVIGIVPYKSWFAAVPVFVACWVAAWVIDVSYRGLLGLSAGTAQSS